MFKELREAAGDIGEDAKGILALPRDLLGLRIGNIGESTRTSIASLLKTPIKAPFHVGWGIIRGTARLVGDLLGNFPIPAPGHK